MAKQKQQGLVRTLPSWPLPVNRPLIIGGLAGLILWVIVDALTPAAVAPKNSENTQGLPAVKVDTTATISPLLKSLPASYQDIETIRKFSPKDENPQLGILLRQFEELQGEYQALRQRLESQDPLPKANLLDPASQQARGSGLVFDGLELGMDSMVGGGRSGEGAAQAKRLGTGKDDELNVSPAQEELVKRNEENRRKLAVARGKDDPSEIYDLHNVVKPVSKYQILAGTIIPASLITGINSSVVGTIVANVRTDIYDSVTGKYLLIPKGSRLIGSYDSHTVSGQRRVLLTFSRIIRAGDGSSILLGRSFGSDLTGQSGIEGNVDNHWARILGAATISTVLSVGTGMASDNVSNPNTNYQGAKQRGIASAGENIGRVGSNITGRAMDIRPTITVSPGYLINVSVRKDMVMTPCKVRR